MDTQTQVPQLQIKFTIPILVTIHYTATPFLCTIFATEQVLCLIYCRIFPSISDKFQQCSLTHYDQRDGLRNLRVCIVLWNTRWVLPGRCMLSQSANGAKR